MPPKRKSSTSSQPFHSNRKAKIIRSCHTCHIRKVSCDRLSPACSACRRHAKTLGNDPDSVVCEYAQEPEPVTIPSPPESVEEQPDGVQDGGGRSLRRTQGRAARSATHKPQYAEDDDEESFFGDDDLVPVGIGLGKDPRRATSFNRETVTVPHHSSKHSLPTPASSPVIASSTINRSSPVSGMSDVSHAVSPVSSSPPTPSSPTYSCSAPYFTSVFSDTSPPHANIDLEEHAAWGMSTFDSFEDTPDWTFSPGLEIFTPTLSATYGTFGVGGGYF